VIEELIDISLSIVQVLFRPRPLHKGGVFDSKTMRSILGHAHFAREVCLTQKTTRSILCCGALDEVFRPRSLAAVHLRVGRGVDIVSYPLVFPLTYLGTLYVRWYLGHGRTGEGPN